MQEIAVFGLAIPVCYVVFRILAIPVLWIIGYIKERSGELAVNERQRRVTDGRFRTPGIIEVMAGVVHSVLAFFIGLLNVVGVILLVAFVLGLVLFFGVIASG